jgi:hypothetical protein
VLCVPDRIGIQSTCFRAGLGREAKLSHSPSCKWTSWTKGSMFSTPASYSGGRDFGSPAVSVEKCFVSFLEASAGLVPEICHECVLSYPLQFTLAIYHATLWTYNHCSWKCLTVQKRNGVVRSAVHAFSRCVFSAMTHWSVRTTSMKTLTTLRVTWVWCLYGYSTHFENRCEPLTLFVPVS